MIREVSHVCICGQKSISCKWKENWIPILHQPEASATKINKLVFNAPSAWRSYGDSCSTINHALFISFAESKLIQYRR